VAKHYPLLGFWGDRHTAKPGQPLRSREPKVRKGRQPAKQSSDGCCEANGTWFVVIVHEDSGSLHQTSNGQAI
jgi:hypothetical protein